MKREILYLLQQSRGVALSVKEIGRRIDREQYRVNPAWARPYLRALAEENLVFEDANHCYSAAADQ
jgi:Fe2+ or Zn2+ uptake regulation protein